ncbi:MAG TPA: NAD(P)-dependent oxidoreductase [Actinokineospora sp.]|jgi:3-hydroxyisobutyrate dehydrogenase|nr:NAD(P)-dependent oxidoreductase [Actinokineospora sp.]
MSTVAFLGLGHMGVHMAGRLVAAGHEVTVWNRTRKSLVGAKVADTPGGAAAGAEIVVTMVSTPAAVESVLFGADGAAAAMRPDAVLVEMSTIGPTAARAIAARLPCPMVDAPVGGGTDKARAGGLTIFTGGEPAAVERVTLVLEAMGTVRPIGGPGSAAAAKLVVNTAMIAGLALLGEVRELGEALGVDADALIAAEPLAALLKRAESTGGHFATHLAAKDLALATEHADLPLARAALARANAAPDTHDVTALAVPTPKANR